MVAAAMLLPMVGLRSPAQAEIVVGYSAEWAGLPAANIALALNDTPASYSSEMRIASIGVPHWITHFRSDVVARGALDASGAVHPGAYDALYDLRKRKDRRISLRYIKRADTAVVERGAADTSHKPQLPERFRANVVDPLSAIAEIRHHLLALRPRPGTRFTVAVYDGARRFDVLAEVQPLESRNRAIRLRLNLVPIAGFKGETSEDGDPDSAPRPVDVEFTDDWRLLPTYLRVSIAWLPFVVHFERLCGDLNECTQPAR